MLSLEITPDLGKLERKNFPDYALDIPASENQSCRVAKGKLHTGNDQEVGLHRTLLISIPIGIFLHRAFRKTKTK